MQNVLAFVKPLPAYFVIIFTELPFQFRMKLADLAKLVWWLFKLWYWFQFSVGFVKSVFFLNNLFWDQRTFSLDDNPLVMPRKLQWCRQLLIQKYDRVGETRNADIYKAVFNSFFPLTFSLDSLVGITRCFEETGKFSESFFWFTTSEE